MIEEHVVSLELGKNLKSLGVSKKSLFYHICLDRGFQIISVEDLEDWADTFNRSGYNRKRFEVVCPAYLASELGEMLPEKIMHEKSSFWIAQTKFKGKNIFQYVHYSDDSYLFKAKEDSEVEAKAVALIWLIEQNHVKAGDLK